VDRGEPAVHPDDGDDVSVTMGRQEETMMMAATKLMKILPDAEIDAECENAANQWSLWQAMPTLDSARTAQRPLSLRSWKCVCLCGQPGVFVRETLF